MAEDRHHLRPIDRRLLKYENDRLSGFRVSPEAESVDRRVCSSESRAGNLLLPLDTLAPENCHERSWPQQTNGSVAEAVGDGQEHRLLDVAPAIADTLGLTEADRQEMVPGRPVTRLNHRLGWAKTMLKKVGLVEYPSSGVLRITGQGKTVLSHYPDKINKTFLVQVLGAGHVVIDSGDDDGDDTPEEQLQDAYSRLRTTLAAEILEKLKKCPPDFFERLVVQLLQAMGYGWGDDAGQATGKPGDEGIDGVIDQDKLGLDVVCIQAKRWEGTVGGPIVRGFAGSVGGRHATKGVLITTGTISKDAREWACTSPIRIVLIDGKQLAELMIDHDIGVKTVSTYSVKKLDSGFFDDVGEV